MLPIGFTYRTFPAFRLILAYRIAIIAPLVDK